MSFLSRAISPVTSITSSLTSFILDPLKKILSPNLKVDVSGAQAPPGREDVNQADQIKLLARRSLAGRQSTIKTGALGDTGVANTASKRLLGQ